MTTRSAAVYAGFASCALAAACTLSGGCSLVAPNDAALTGGERTSACRPGEKRCGGKAAQTCDASGQWQTSQTCPYVCSAGACTGVCVPDVTQCNGSTPQSCDGSGAWVSGTTCSNQTCTGGTCQGVCAQGQTRCSGNDAQTCDPSGQWTAPATCGSQACVSGVCQGACAPNARGCNAQQPQRCDTTGSWQSDGATCPMVCEGAGVCAMTSCANGAAGQADCGPNGNDSCCSSLLVSGGTFSRSYDGVTSGYTDPQYQAAVSDFRLDKYEITVGRFRRFVDAVVAGWTPAAGAGKHAHLNGGSGLSNGGAAGTFEPGWDVTWNAFLPSTKAGWDATSALSCNASNQTWTVAAGSNEARPINCVDWYKVAAFCIWDGGFLPSEAEWNYAATGGNEQRVYPWGTAAPGPNAALAVWGCYWNGTGSCSGVTNIAPVGSVPAGNGRWGQSDLAGNVWEWTLDGYKTPYNETLCANCANSANSAVRVFRGGFFFRTVGNLLSSYRNANAPSFRIEDIGSRCARSP